MRWRTVLGVVTVGVCVLSSLEAVEQVVTERIAEDATLEHRVGRVTVRGSGALSTDVFRLHGSLEVRQLGGTPWFATTSGRFDHENHQAYNLQQLGGTVGVGYAITKQTNLLADYRFDHYRIFGTGASSDPAFQSVAGGSWVTAMELMLQHDTRDDRSYPTRGMRSLLRGDLALRAFGGDYDFGGFDADMAYYTTPFRDHLTQHAWLDNLVLVEHVRFGWQAHFGATDDVPFFERYYVGGSSTVRGHRPRWLSPRGLEDEFVGGEVQFVNNIELRELLFPRLLHRRLSAALFADAGRSAHRLAGLSRLGYGVGGGLRYALQIWHVHGVARADLGINPHPTGDDSRIRLHLTISIPF